MDYLTRVRSAEWVASNAAELSDAEKYSLTSDPNRNDWFAHILRDLDFEIEGGTWEEPLWAWKKHPWFDALNLTEDECIKYLQNWQDD